MLNSNEYFKIFIENLQKKCKQAIKLFKAGLKKTRLKKTSPVGCFGFFGSFCFFYMYPEERVFSLFSVSRILLGASRL